MADREKSYPRTLDGVLRLAVENTDTSDQASSSRNAEALSTGEREWLSEAIAHGVSAGPSPSSRVKEIMDLTTRWCSSSVTEVTETERPLSDTILELLEEAIEWCEDIDVANDFVKMDSTRFLEMLLNHDAEGFRMKGAEFVAAVCQNNESSQTACVSLLPLLLQRVDSGSCDQTRVKAQFAVSSLVRGCSAAEELFLKKDGLSVVLRAMSSNIKNLKVKATFFLIGLCRDNLSIKETLCRMGLVDELVGLLKSPHDEFHEHIMAALLTLLTDCAPAQSEAANERLHLVDLLQERVAFLNGREESEEELEAAKACLEIVTSYRDCDSAEPGVDR